MPKLLIIPRQDTAVGYYRQELPARILRKLGYDVLFDLTVAGRRKPSLSGWLLNHSHEPIDLFLTDRGASIAEVAGTPPQDNIPSQMGYAGFRDATGARMLVDFDDDFLQLPPWNEAKKLFMPGMGHRMAGLAHLRLSEITTVSTRELEARFGPRTHAIRCAPNYIDPDDWSGPINPARAADPRLRILYAGAAGHYGDLNIVQTALGRILRNPPVPSRLICFNAVPRWMHDIRRELPDRVVTLPWVPFYSNTPGYRRAVAWGGFDIAIAPLADHPFNHCRSHIKFLEAACLGQAFIGSKVGPYADLPTDCATIVDNTPQAWEAALVDLMTNPDRRASQTKRAREYVLDTWTLEQAKPVWSAIVETALSLPRIQTYEDTVVPLMDGHPTA